MDIHVRNVDPDLWRRVRMRAAAEKHPTPLREIVLALLRMYADGLKLKGANK